LKTDIYLSGYEARCFAFFTLRKIFMVNKELFVLVLTAALARRVSGTNSSRSQASIV
jgi:hypothetical protein